MKVSFLFGFIILFIWTSSDSLARSTIKGHPARASLVNALSPPLIKTSSGFEKPFFGGKLFLREDGTLEYHFPKFSFAERLVGSLPASLTPLAPQEAKVNLFLGGNPSSWKQFSTWGKVSLGEIYPGITLELVSHPENVEKVFRLAPGAQVERIKVKLSGLKGLRLLPDGRLELTNGREKVYFSKPVAYQEINGQRREVEVAYVVAGKSYGFRLGAYDPRFPVTIDPQLIFATYLGGERDDALEDITTDPQGNIYFAGITKSEDLPVTTETPYPSQVNQMIFAGKISAGPEFRLLYLTYLGGTGYARTNQVTKIAATPEGELVLTGYTSTENFPLKDAVYAYPRDSRGTESGYSVGFLTKLGSGGGLVFSTYLGQGCYPNYLGNFGNTAASLTLDSSGNIFVTGNTDLPFLSSDPEAWCPIADFYVLKFSGTGKLLKVYRNPDASFKPADITAIPQGDVYIVGQGNTELNSNFTPWANLWAFANDLRFIYSYFIRGSSDKLTIPYAIALDEANNIYLAGYTYATDLPGIDGRISGTDADGQFFVTKLSPKPEVTYTVLIGKDGLEGVCGDDRHRCFDMALDAAGNIFLTGEAQKGYPLTDDAWSEYPDYNSAFFTWLNPSGNLVFSTKLPRTEPFCITHYAGKVYLAGRVAYPSDLQPAHAIQEEHAQTAYGSYDGFIMGIDLEPTCDTTHLALCTTEAACLGAGGHWCEEKCQAEACAQEPPLGDLDGDGRPTVIDALLVARCALNLMSQGCDSPLADVDCNSQVNIIDALLIARKALGLVVIVWCE